MTYDMTATVQWPEIVRLDSVLRQLSERDRSFAMSLQAQQSHRYLSEKQLFWVRELTKRGEAKLSQTSQPSQAPAAPASTSFSRIVELFGKAGRRAVVVFRTQDGTDFRLSIAGEGSQQPGSINVTDTSRGYDNRTWFGRIGTNGAWQPSRKLDARTIAQVEAALTAFNADPAKAAAAYGHMVGSCCFCSRELTDERSVSVGYGPICADRFGLPWGEVPAKADASIDKLTCDSPF